VQVIGRQRCEKHDIVQAIQELWWRMIAITSSCAFCVI
jgi:hypothetical protein